MSKWSVVYEKAIREDGSLLFPERLSQEFLDAARRTMGRYIFANQYQNETIPEGSEIFKREWLKYYSEIPKPIATFAFIDPGISKADTADYTAIVIVDVDVQSNWYVRSATHARLNPTEIINMCFEIADRYNARCIGIEDVAFQRALVHFAHEEMKRRGKHIPVAGIKVPNEKSKETRIMGLVPRFEFGTIFLNRHQDVLEAELLAFPRGANDDTIDALASIEAIAYAPQPIRVNNEPKSPNDPGYESWYIKQLLRRATEGERE